MKILCLIALLALTGCGPHSAEEYQKDAENSIVYVKDPRTGLCFTRTVTYGGASVYSYIPCEVIKDKSLIKDVYHYSPAN